MKSKEVNYLRRYLGKWITYDACTLKFSSGIQLIRTKTIENCTRGTREDYRSGGGLTRRHYGSTDAVIVAAAATALSG